jgi:UDP-N-acetylmuramate--alanine ligase
LFQPHLYSRTKYHSKAFAASFHDADIVLISQIYPAREKVRSDSFEQEHLYGYERSREEEKPQCSIVSKTFIWCLKEKSGPGDLVVSMGAGEINRMLYRLKK